MKTPRRRTLQKQIARLQHDLRRASLPNDEKIRDLRIIIGAYVYQYGPMRVSHIQDLASRMERIGARARFDYDNNEWIAPGETVPQVPKDTVGVLLLMAARHALATRDDGNAFAWAEACVAVAHRLDPVRAEVVGQAVVQSLVFEPKPFKPLGYAAEMERGVKALLPRIRPERRFLVEDYLNRFVDLTLEPKS